MKRMNIACAVVCAAILTSSCKDEKTATEMTPLKSDSTFVMKPELPVQDSATGAEKTTAVTNSGVTRKNPVSGSTRSGTQTGSTSTTPQGTTTQTGTTTPAKKAGWSKTAKGAVIGGVVGAGTGAVVNKRNRAAGAVIGGVIGAGAGAVIGNEMDKKDGRH